MKRSLQLYPCGPGFSYDDTCTYLQQQEAVKVQIECGMQGGLAYACPAFGSYAELVKMTSGTKRWKTHIKTLKKNKSAPAAHHAPHPKPHLRNSPHNC